MRQRNVTPPQVEKILELADAGMQQKAIAAAVGVTVGAVAGVTLKYGVMLGKIRVKPCRRPMMRKGVLVRPFTEEEDRRLLELDLQGARVVDMAQALDRRQHSIIARLRTIARWETHMEDRA